MIASKQKTKTSFLTDNPLGAPLQGQDSIIIKASTKILWPMIANSKHLEDWGPPVTHVEILTSPEQAENVGSCRRVDVEIGGKKGYFIERRLEHVEEKRMRFVMEDETFGLSKIMTDTGASLELEAIDAQTTRVIFTFYHRPKGILGYLMNRLIVLHQQHANRLLALQSLKAFAESHP